MRHRLWFDKVEVAPATERKFDEGKLREILERGRVERQVSEAADA